MSRTTGLLLAVMLVGGIPARAEEPPYQRLLQGDDARKAAALQRQADRLGAAGKFEEAVKPAEELLALRKRVQGQEHWEAMDAARLVESLRLTAALPETKRTALAEIGAVTGKARSLYVRGKYAEAEPLHRKVVAVYEDVLGPKHPDTATEYNNLAIVIGAQGRYREAELLYRKTLAVCEEVLGSKHPRTATACNNLAANLDAQGRYKEAEPLHRRALAVREVVLGPKHPDTATTSDNLAINLTNQGRAREAEPLLRKGLAVREEMLRRNHPNIARSCNNLASNLHQQGRYKEAEPLYRQALGIAEAVLGRKHPNTATSYHNLAVNLYAQGRYKEAEPLHRGALAVREEVLGPKHPDTALSCDNLALDLAAQGHYKEAELLHRRALAITEGMLGPAHPDTALGYCDLASNLEQQGRYKEAEPLYRRALAVLEEVLGPEHPHTARTCDFLASNLQAQGRAREAEPLYRRALAVREAVLGRKHADTAASCDNLASNLQEQGRSREAEFFHRRALAIFEAVLDPKHPEIRTTCGNLAITLEARGRAREAEPLKRRALAIAVAVDGPKHPNTAICCNNLASNLDVQGRHKEAEPLYRQALDIVEEVLGPKHFRTANSCNNLAVNLLIQGRAREAEPLHRRALAVREEVLGLKHPATALACDNLAADLQAQNRLEEAEPLWQKGADAVETYRLRLAASTLDRAVAVRIHPHLGLAACRAHRGRPEEAWSAAEAGLARGLLDDLASRAGLPLDPDAERQDRERATRRDAIDRDLIPLLIAAQLDEANRCLRDELLKEREDLDGQAARAAAQRSRKAVLPLKEVQAGLAPDAALVFWVDNDFCGEHWGCVVRRSGAPAWVRLPGSGTGGAWTPEDNKLPFRLYNALSRGEPYDDFRSRLAAQRLAPLVPHLAAGADLPAVRHLVVVPVGRMAGVPLEVLSDHYLVSYAPSGTVFARLRARHRPLAEPTLLALGDPNFTVPTAGPPPVPPDCGLYLSLVLPSGNAARAGLRSGDILLSYAGKRLSSRDDLKVAEGGEPVAVSLWRDGSTEERRVAPGNLGVVLSADPPAVALRRRREAELLADSRERSDVMPLPGTRLEVAAIAALLPEGRSRLLLGSRASEQELDALAAAGKLKDYRLLHLATHGFVDPLAAEHSALELARDRLPGPGEQARLAAAGKKVATGRLSVGTIGREWDLDADLVALSACQTGLGPDGGGEGLLGFSQVLLGRGARSLLLSLWKVDDTATALLMLRFYQNLLGKREGLKKPLPRAEALREAKTCLRGLPRAEVETLAGKLAKGVVRATEEPRTPAAPMKVPKPAVPAGDKPFAHPRYWAAFILIGDPE
jgi:tetratricopeptide (TPR) repeat protein